MYVDASSHVNQARLCGDESGTQSVPIYNWLEFLVGYFRRLPKILSYQHFYLSSDSPGVVKFKELADGPEQEFQICKKNPPNTLPERIRPKGLDHARKTYLYEQIRQFCTPKTQDLVCPRVHPGT